MNHTNTQEEAQRQTKPLALKIKELVERTKSIILVTVDAEGTSNSGYAPFVQVENTFYILVSFMVKHKRILLTEKNINHVYRR